MRRDLEHEDIQRVFASHQLHTALGRIIKEYANPTDTSQEKAQDVAKRYAIARREYWDKNARDEDATLLRQIWTDALVHAATEDNWSTLRQAIGFDIIEYGDRSTPIAQQRSTALLNLMKLL